MTLQCFIKTRILNNGKMLEWYLLSLPSLVRVTSHYVECLFIIRETLYQSYPLVDTRSGTWEPVEDLNLGVLVHSSEELSFRVTVHDCDAKRGNHRLIGTVEVKSSELTGNMPTISIERGGKSKGILRFDRFDLDWSA